MNNIRLQNPYDEHELMVDEQFRVIVEGMNSFLVEKRGEVILGALALWLDRFVTIDELSQRLLHEDDHPYPVEFDSEITAKTDINNRFRMLSKGTGGYDRYGSVCKNLCKIGNKSLARFVLLSDTKSPDHGLQLIDQSLPAEKNLYYKSSFIEYYEDTFNVSVPYERPIDKALDERAGRRLLSPEDMYGSRLRQQYEESRSALDKFVGASEGSVFDHIELTEGRQYTQGQRKANYEALRQALKRGVLKSDRNDKGRTVYIRL